MLITFSGLDGCGKTTQIRLFTEYLKDKGFSYKVIAMYDDISFSGFIRKILGKDKKDINKKIKEYRQDKNRKDKHLVFLRKIAYLLDLFNYKRKIRGYRRNRCVLVVDRCFYDTLANLHNTGSDRYIKRMLDLSPKADLAFFLDADPESAFKRKPEYDPEFYKERREGYRRIFNYVKGEVVDSNREMDHVKDDIRKRFEEKKG